MTTPSYRLIPDGENRDTLTRRRWFVTRRDKERKKCGIHKVKQSGTQQTAVMLWGITNATGVEMGVIGNILWFIFGGFVMGLGWWLAGLLAAITIVGIPWAKACFVIGQFAFLPFGKQAVSRKDLTKKDDIGTGAMGLIGNIIWFVFAGIWLAVGHLGSALLCFVTIIGIPFGIQHLKLAVIALAPIGKTIVDKNVAARAGRSLI